MDEAWNDVGRNDMLTKSACLPGRVLLDGVHDVFGVADESYDTPGTVTRHIHHLRNRGLRRRLYMKKKNTVY